MNTDTNSRKLEKTSLTTWSLMNSGRRMITKIGFLPFLRGPILLRKLRQISEQRNFVQSTISVTPSDSRMRNISDSRIFLWVFSEHTKWPSNDFSLIWAECDSSRDFCQTPLVRELFKPAEFGSRFSSGVRLQSSSKGRIRLKIPFLSDCWVAVSS